MYLLSVVCVCGGGGGGGIKDEPMEPQRHVMPNTLSSMFSRCTSKEAGALRHHVHAGEKSRSPFLLSNTK